MEKVGGARLSAAAIVGAVVAVGTLLATLTRDDSRPADLGLALLSGGLVGGSLILVESMLAQAAERRHERAALRWQLTSTTELSGIDLSSRDLSGYYLPGKALVAAKCANASLANSVLIYGDLRHADLSGADLRGADLSGCTLRFADLRGANLEGAVLNDTDLRDACFENANLTDTQITTARMYRATLSGARLQGATLTEVGLDGVDLSATSGLTSNRLQRIQWDERTIWPVGVKAPPSVPKVDHHVADMGIADYLAWRRNPASERNRVSGPSDHEAC